MTGIQSIDAMTAKRALGRLLQKAYSGELAAAHAYRGHARSVRSATQREAIRGIEEDEWRHRLRVGEMIAEIGVRPSRAREVIFYCIGKLVALSCFVGGWFIPMYGAGRIERRNIAEYEVAARLAWRAGYEAWADELLEMAEVEWDHERYFRSRIRKHWLYRWFPRWPSAGRREGIRRRFAADTRARANDDLSGKGCAVHNRDSDSGQGPAPSIVDKSPHEPSMTRPGRPASTISAGLLPAAGSASEQEQRRRVQS